MMSYSGYVRDGRDVARKADLQSIEKTLALYEIKHGTYPLPDNAASVTHSGWVVWHQGTFGDTNHKAVRILTEKPVDPSFGLEYSYSLLANKTEFELATVFEWDTFSYIPGVAQSYAANSLAYVTGTYNSRFSVSRNAGNVDIIALPNITSSRDGTHSISDIVQDNLLVMNGKQNLPANYNIETFDQTWLVEESISNPIVFSGQYSELSTIEEKRNFIIALQNSYEDTEILKDSQAQFRIESLLNINPNNDMQVEAFFEKISISQAGGFSYK